MTRLALAILALPAILHALAILGGPAGAAHLAAGADPGHVARLWPMLTSTAHLIAAAAILRRQAWSFLVPWQRHLLAALFLAAASVFARPYLAALAPEWLAEIELAALAYRAVLLGLLACLAILGRRAWRYARARRLILVVGVCLIGWAVALTSLGLAAIMVYPAAWLAALTFIAWTPSRRPVAC